MRSFQQSPPEVSVTVNAPPSEYQEIDIPFEPNSYVFTRHEEIPLHKRLAVQCVELAIGYLATRGIVDAYNLESWSSPAYSLVFSIAPYFLTRVVMESKEIFMSKRTTEAADYVSVASRAMGLSFASISSGVSCYSGLFKNNHYLGVIGFFSGVIGEVAGEKILTKIQDFGNALNFSR